MAKVFVSYARDETKKVYRILGKLKEHGIEFWVDTQDIENGKDWAEEIGKGIKNCRRILLFMSKLSMASSNTAQEVKIAFGSNKRFVVLRLDDVKYPIKLKYALEGIQWTDYWSADWETKIVTALGGGKKYFRKPKPSSGKPIQTTVSIPKKPRKPRLVIAELEHKFSENRIYYRDECDAALLELDILRSVARAHWINPALAYNELVSREDLMDKIEVVQNLIRNYQESSSSIKRELIHNELKTLVLELSQPQGR
jgi:hypothetical protein